MDATGHTPVWPLSAMTINICIDFFPIFHKSEGDPYIFSPITGSNWPSPTWLIDKSLATSLNITTSMPE
jgi:hypothetical protein